jgi:hypothetical protein
MPNYRDIQRLSESPQEYELRREETIARNNARLVMLGLDSKLKEAKTKVVKQRKSLPEDAPRRELPDRKCKVVTYNEDEHLGNLGLVKDVEN